MIKYISNAIKSFAGTRTHTRCFNHIIHLTAKSLLRPFNVTTGKDAAAAMHATEASLRELAGGLELEEAEMMVMGMDAVSSNSNEVEKVGVENVEGEFDEVQEMLEEERERLDETVLPVKVVLVKVRSHGYPGNTDQYLPAMAF